MPYTEILQNQEISKEGVKNEKCEKIPSFFNLYNSNELKKAVIYSEIFSRKF